MASSETSTLHSKGDRYIKFQSVVFHWPRSLSFGKAWNGKAADLEALRLHLDTRNWFEKEAAEAAAAANGSSGAGLRGRGGFGGGGGGGVSTRPRCESCMFLKWGSDGENEAGVELYIGHSPDLRMALLFSVDAIERFVRRLKDEQHTSSILPLPEPMSAEQVGTFTSIERHVVKSQKAFRAIQQKVDKQNKRITHEENMSKWGKEYEHIRRVWQGDEQITAIGLDVETWETGHKEMLEVGWSVVSPHSPQETFHFIVEEAFADGRRNGRYVADNRRNFIFGKVLDKPLVGRFPSWSANGSEIAYSFDVGRYFMQSITEFRRKGPVYVVFHDSKGDMKVMEEFGIDTRDWSYFLLGKQAEAANKTAIQQPTGDILLSSIMAHKTDPSEFLHPVYILDTQLLFAAIRCHGVGEKKSLKNICIALDVNDGNLNYFHNAANDAHYTAAALVKMAEGPHFTEMRGIAEARLALEQERTAMHNSSAAKRRAPSSSASATWD